MRGGIKIGSKCTHDLDQVLRDDLVEPCQECLDLVLDRRVETVVGRELDELPLVLVRDWDLCTVLLQLNELGDTELHLDVSTK